MRLGVLMRTYPHELVEGEGQHFRPPRRDGVRARGGAPVDHHPLGVVVDGARADGRVEGVGVGRHAELAEAAPVLPRVGARAGLVLNGLARHTLQLGVARLAPAGVARGDGD